MACSPPPYPSWWSSATTVTIQRESGAGNISNVAKADVTFTVDGVEVTGSANTYIPWSAVLSVTLAS